MYLMSDFLFRSNKSSRNQPSLSDGDVINTKRGVMTVLKYGDRNNVKVQIEGESDVRYVTVQWIRRNEVQ